MTGKPGGGFGFLSDELQTLLVVYDEIMYPASNDAAEQWYPTDRKALRRNLLDGLERRWRELPGPTAVSATG